MKQKRIVLTVSSLLILSIGILFFVFGFHNKKIKVDNTTPAEQVVTKKYGLEKQLLAKEIFYVRRGFRDVNAFDLAKEVGIKLECKRQISENQFYYVVLGDYRCFIVVDEKDTVQDVLTIRDFPTIEQTKKWLERDDHEMYVTDTMEYGFRNLWRSCGASSVYWTALFTLEDGAMMIRSTGKMENAQYLFFTDEEWQQVYKDYDGFVILPIDKQ